MRPRRLVLGTTAVVAAALVAGGCAAPASRYRSDAVDFIRGDTMFQAYSVDFQDIECGEPDTTDEGATLACAATDPETDQAYVLTFTIVGKNELELTDIVFAGDTGETSDTTGTDDTGDPGATSEPASSAPLPTAPPVAGADATTTTPG